MFVQIIKGKTSDAQGVRRQFDQWVSDLAGQATGWRGTTAGVSDDGTLVALVEFESVEAARRNSERPEQGAWWSQTEPLLSDVTFADADEVMTFRGGADPSARFVQVIEAPVTDRDAARAMADEELPQDRPDVLGGLVAVHGDRATQVVYFTDEASAREGESQEPSEEEQRRMDGMRSAFGDPTFLDLRDPWHNRP